ncbi:hypothetical protein HMPREF7215_1306 [Pyramidobacter piscolens W5455]|uniref:Uncharacterized protein n=1 Tax=Pyramidobacter piscolens W5455 TaxID=352165 RepID=A0ABM9ZRQ7_9BACT|nr:hypothetical protein HMPREF7215_1306 [Pyramidobacter piscolens W5455]
MNFPLYRAEFTAPGQPRAFFASILSLMPRSPKRRPFDSVRKRA